MNTFLIENRIHLNEFRTDPLRLKQILLNLLSNAAKFTSHGKITLTINTSESSKKQFIDFSITDTGIGLSEEQIDKLFQDFQQATTETTRKFGGTGLGLSISKKLACLMGGDINVVSAPGQGSTFTLRLPLSH